MPRKAKKVTDKEVDDLMETTFNTKKVNMKKVVISTVVTTLLVVAAFGATFYAGTQFQENQHKAIAEQVELLAADSKTNGSK